MNNYIGYPQAMQWAESMSDNNIYLVGKMREVPTNLPDVTTADYHVILAQVRKDGVHYVYFTVGRCTLVRGEPMVQSDKEFLERVENNQDEVVNCFRSFLLDYVLKDSPQSAPRIIEASVSFPKDIVIMEGGHDLAKFNQETKEYELQLIPVG